MNNVMIEYANLVDDEATMILVKTLTNTKLAKVLDDVTPDTADVVDVTREGDKKSKLKLDFETNFLMKCFVRKYAPDYERDVKRRIGEYEEAKENATLS